MTNKNPVTHPRSDFSPTEKKFVMHLKFELKKISFLLKRVSMSDYFKVAYNDRIKRICAIYIISKQFLDLISYPQKGYISRILYPWIYILYKSDSNP